jgi:hypothetical protein
VGIFADIPLLFVVVIVIVAAAAASLALAIGNTPPINVCQNFAVRHVRTGGPAVAVWMGTMGTRAGNDGVWRCPDGRGREGAAKRGHGCIDGI